MISNILDFAALAVWQGQTRLLLLSSLAVLFLLANVHKLHPLHEEPVFGRSFRNQSSSPVSTSQTPFKFLMRERGQCTTHSQTNEDCVTKILIEDLLLRRE
ncbi:hypothetical protein F4679DRAFT_43127 [Xylaria curta]|nr:hypothetical protein F4679DRAFT_43127 [Xylaria curta]